MSIREDLLIPHAPVDTDTEEQAADRVQLHKLLCWHDWFYDRADDYGAYRDGELSWKNICALSDKVPGGRELLRAQQKRIWG